MKKQLLYFFLILIIITGCSSNKSTINSTNSNGTIGYVEAKEMIINKGAVVLDVRTKEEYEEKHIDGALSLPVDEITTEKVASIINDNNTIMIVYCKSGVRSAQAVTKLNDLGYNNVYNLGAMSNWKE